MFSVSRQIIVSDIALLRASGADIVATPQGYLIPRATRASQRCRTLVACCHGPEGTQGELELIVDLGGTVEDVLVDHPLYGELKGTLALSSREDVRKFMAKMSGAGARPLSVLTEGVHLHTITARDEETLQRIVGALGEAGYLCRHGE
jgi:transcriptional regulator of NAD metabolism